MRWLSSLAPDSRNWVARPTSRAMSTPSGIERFNESSSGVFLVAQIRELLVISTKKAFETIGITGFHQAAVFWGGSTGWLPTK